MELSSNKINSNKNDKAKTNSTKTKNTFRKNDQDYNISNVNDTNNGPNTKMRHSFALLVEDEKINGASVVFSSVVIR